MNPPKADHGYGRPSWRPRVFLRQTPRDYARDRQDRLPLRRTVQVRLGFDFGFWISDLGFLSTVNDIELTVQMSRFVLRFSQAFQQIFIPQSAFRNPHSSTRWHTHLLRARSAPLSPASGFPVSWSRDSN